MITEILAHRFNRYIYPISLTLLLISAAMLGTVEQLSLTTDSGYITGHLVHSNVQHLIMNVSALWMITLFLNNSTINQLHLWVVTLLSVIAIDVLFVTHLSVDYAYYVGYSGVLYALCTFLLVKGKDIVLCIAALLCVSWTIQTEYQSISAELIGIPVANKAHMVGAVVGWLYGIVTNILYRTQLTFSPNSV